MLRLHVHQRPLFQALAFSTFGGTDVLQDERRTSAVNYDQSAEPSFCFSAGRQWLKTEVLGEPAAWFLLLIFSALLR